MGRRPRIHYPGAIYHAMARGVDGRETFTDNRDRHLFLTALTGIKQETSFTLFAYCLMGNHFHLAIKVGDVPLSRILQRLLTRYASAYNARHDRTGHLFQARYKAVLCINERHLLRLVEYIHANPVRSGLVTGEADWPWSSSEVYLKDHSTALVDPADLPSTLGLRGNTQTTSEAFDPWPKEHSPAPILLRKHPQEREALESLAIRVSVSTNIPIEILRSGRRGSLIVQAKRAFIISCLRQGHTLANISRWLCCSHSSAHYLAYGGKNSKESKA